jgi:polypeptide N-acetylgalactosaminyltransferase
LVRIVDNPKRLVCPVIENIRLTDYAFEPVSTYLRGGFNWQLEFFWEWLPVKDTARRLRDPTLPVPTPAIAGGLFAINREWFIELGIYDSAMEVL